MLLSLRSTRAADSAWQCLRARKLVESYKSHCCRHYIMVYSLPIAILLTGATGACSLTIRGIGGSTFLASQNSPNDPSIFPMPCQPSCVAISDILDLCNQTTTFPTCICRDIYGQIAEDCLNCLTCNNFPNIAEIANNSTTEFNTGCSQSGILVTPISVNSTC